MDYKRVLYVGGLAESVSEDLLKAAFIPFGVIKELEIPTEQVPVNNNDINSRKVTKSRGFGYVEFKEEEDAEAARDNMDQSELHGRVLRVDIAKKGSIKIGAKRPTWHVVNEWYSEKLNKDGFINEEEAIEFDKRAKLSN